MSERKMIMERLLSVAEAADLLGTTARFPRRLIAERRIRFVRVGRHIRIPESAIGEFVAPARSNRSPGPTSHDSAEAPSLRKHPAAQLGELSGALLGS
jgi:excisionase family DNA binding protein